MTRFLLVAVNPYDCPEKAFTAFQGEIAAPVVSLKPPGSYAKSYTEVSKSH
jgi:hypothetical protein